MSPSWMCGVRALGVSPAAQAYNFTQRMVQVSLLLAPSDVEAWARRSTPHGLWLYCVTHYTLIVDVVVPVMSLCMHDVANRRGRVINHYELLPINCHK